MKKILLGTTALVAAAGFGGAASAQQVTTKATSLSIAGQVEFEAAYADSDADNANRKIDFLSDGDLTFSPKYVADNGLTTTGRLDFEYSKGGSFSPDELSITFQSASFGSITLGDDDGTGDNFWQYGPLTGDGNWDGSATRFLTDDLGWAGDNSDLKVMNQDATKIFYSTQGLDLAGFTFGASYTPKSNDTFDSGNGLSKSAGSFSDIYDAGVTWKGEVAGVKISGGGIYASGKKDLTGEVATGYNVGGTVGFGAFSVGGGYTGFSDVYAVGADDSAWSLGATYAVGALTLGIDYQKSEYEAASAKADSSTYGAAISYAVAPGVTTLGEINQFKNDDTDEEATVVMLGTKVAF